MKQSRIFLESEGDAWHERNKNKDRFPDPVIQIIYDREIYPREVLEIGCGEGWRLRRFKEDDPQCRVTGIDTGNHHVINDDVYLGTADDLPFKDNSFDLVIFGFCLYVCDREDLFKIAYEADRVLQDQGYLIIHDFYPGDVSYCRTYSHDRRIKTFKMDYAKLFTGNPCYKLIEQRVFGTETDTPKGPDDQVCVAVLKKDLVGAWPLRDPE